MFLKRIVLENIRGLPRLDLSFEGAEDDVRRWTMTLGENGTGKSTLLRSIALVLAGSEALPELLVSPRHWVRKGERAGAIEADLVTAENKPRKLRLELRPGDTIREIFERNRESMADLDYALAQSARNSAASARPAQSPPSTAAPSGWITRSSSFRPAGTGGNPTRAIGKRPRSSSRRNPGASAPHPKQGTSRMSTKLSSRHRLRLLRG
jgi:energy-coupling factor transporter ATP-binding protein EcfA2